MNQGSQIWKPYRILGLYGNNDIPFILTSSGIENFIKISIEKTYLVFKCDKLSLVGGGIEHHKRIHSIEKGLNIDQIFTASGKNIYYWQRNELLATFKGHKSNIFQLLLFGYHLLSLSEDNIIKIWDIKNKIQFSELEFPKNFSITVMMHPDTYLNKIILGSQQGILQLWNVKTKKLIYTFDHSWKSPIICIEQSPVVDVVGIGLANGKIILHNLKLDKTIVTFFQNEGIVTSLSFRTDSHPILASSNIKGSISIWDLEGKKLQTIIKDAHNEKIIKIKFLKDEPILITSGDDNSLKMWIFDQADGSARLLKSRSGHSEPPTHIKYHPSFPSFIISCSSDKTFRLTCTIDRMNCELSQGPGLQKKAKELGIKKQDLKLNPIIDFDLNDAKEKEWDNIITCHENSSIAYTWNFQKRIIGKHQLQSTEPKKTPIKSVAISTCGNFAIIGTASGWIDKFNIQSGIHRGSFHDVAGYAHTASIQGLVTEALNKMLISGSLDSYLKFWDFHLLKLIQTIYVGSPINKLKLNKESSLLALVTDDLIIRIFDIDTFKLIRKFEGHENQITDIAISPDSRWIVSSSVDKTVRVWDLPSGKMIDWFLIDNIITSMSFNPLGNFLSTTHVGKLGIYQWVNKTYFSSIMLHSPPEKPNKIVMPNIISIDENEYEEHNNEDEVLIKENENSINKSEIKTKSQLSKELITLSNLPASKWLNLSELDIIKKRNKPKEPPKKPEKAPFFLPTKPGFETIFLPPQELNNSFININEDTSKILHVSKFETKTKFIQLLEKGNELKDYTETIEYLKTLNPSSIDLEFISLNTNNNGKLLKLILEMFNIYIDNNKDFELIQSYLKLFLKYHLDNIIHNPELVSMIKELKKKEKEKWRKLQSLFHSNLCLIHYLSGIQM
jgi:U3 small nucleolar RNA-associated protein 21